MRRCGCNRRISSATCSFCGKRPSVCGNWTSPRCCCGRMATWRGSVTISRNRSASSQVVRLRPAGDAAGDRGLGAGCSCGCLRQRVGHPAHTAGLTWCGRTGQLARRRGGAQVRGWPSIGVRLCPTRPCPSVGSGRDGTNAGHVTIRRSAPFSRVSPRLRSTIPTCLRSSSTLLPMLTRPRRLPSLQGCLRQVATSRSSLLRRVVPERLGSCPRSSTRAIPRSSAAPGNWPGGWRAAGPNT